MMSVAAIIVLLVSPTSPDTQEVPEEIEQTEEVQEILPEVERSNEENQKKEEQYKIIHDDSIHIESSENDQIIKSALEDKKTDTIEEEINLTDETRVNEVFEKPHPREKRDQPIQGSVTPILPITPTVPTIKGDSEEKE